MSLLYEWKWSGERDGVRGKAKARRGKERQGTGTAAAQVPSKGGRRWETVGATLEQVAGTRQEGTQAGQGRAGQGEGEGEGKERGGAMPEAVGGGDLLETRWGKHSSIQAFKSSEDGAAQAVTHSLTH